MTNRDFRADMAFDDRAAWLAKIGRLPVWSPDWRELTPREWLGALPAPRQSREGVTPEEVTRRGYHLK